ncbi:hypothetical protein [Enterococcus columbae]|uniref:Flagellar basal body rod modification protein n=1 Tax=Enterococcus columbae DSM 7374 = ATCC 51263 TaxID=1121865 RepID=S0K4K4_9ENTE|nr:hypothetical protein [Enterococcus columbae]EOT40004.1 hypothetical protein OMW_01793 [Enterococcus columbae DSM 7374 = ATCC 51263]EOW83989.1 hypothetical protein I568_01436 [Enterococcus columbae DSM 7374 = ATCC 51263]OJG25792.1 hypothetical protein RR47_GL001298 [Enterococcus columbae DSM 7374 = ATCC 51263]
MPINDIQNIQSTLTTPAPTTKSDPSEISMDDFLKILAASMSNPAIGGSESSGGNQGTDYISQFVEFTSLQQLQSLGKSLENSVKLQQQQQAFSLIGKEVTLNQDGKEVKGKIEKVKILNGVPMVTIDHQDYASANITEVSV